MNSTRARKEKVGPAEWMKTSGNGDEIQQGRTKTVAVSIRPVNMQQVIFGLVGVAPYVQNRFSEKAKQAIMDTQKAGSVAKGKKIREPKDFDAIYEAAQHKTKEGWVGIPAPAFRNAMISACRTVGYKMTHAKLSVFVQPDGFDEGDGTPLVKITSGVAEKHTAYARNDNGSVDIRCRPMWREGWKASLRVQFDGDMFTVQDVFNLLKRAGSQVGIGEGRPDSRNSAGLGWGLFDVTTSDKGAE